MGSEGAINEQRSISFSSHDANTGSVRVYFDDDDESYFDLNIQTMPEPGDFQFNTSGSLRSTEPSTHATADELFDGGLIVPLERLELVRGATTRARTDSAATPPKSPGVEVRTEGGIQDNPREVKGSSSTAAAVSGRRFNGSGRVIVGRNVEIRKPSKLKMTINSGVLRFLINFPSEKIRVAFVSFARSHNHSRIEHDENNTRSIQETKSVNRGLLMPIYKWFARKKPQSSNREKKPRIVDINGEDYIKMRSKSKHMDSWSRPNSAPTSPQSSPHHHSAYNVKKKVVERDGSISSAIAYCKGIDRS